MPLAALAPRLADLASPDGESLARALRGLDDLDALAAHAVFSDTQYVRVPLGRPGEVELRLLCWLPGQTSSLHQHGPAACAFRVVRGTATELRLTATDRVLRAGDADFSPPGLAHQVGNYGREPLITLHAYAPALPVDQPAPQDGHHVAVLGGGREAVELAAILLGYDDPDLRVTMFAPSPIRGAAAAGCGALVAALATSRSRLRLERAAPWDVRATADGWTIHLSEGRSLRVDDVVTARRAAVHAPSPGSGGEDAEIGVLDWLGELRGRLARRKIGLA